MISLIKSKIEEAGILAGISKRAFDSDILNGGTRIDEPHGYDSE